MLPNRPNLFFRYGVAALLVALALLLKLTVLPLSQREVPFLVFFAAVMLSAYLGGRGPGLLATLLAAVASNFFFMPPVYQFGFTDPSQKVHLYVFIGEAIIASLLCGRLYASRLEIQRTAAETLAIRIAQTSESEKRRIGHDLHDGLGQVLTAISLRCKSLSARLKTQAPQSAAEAEELSAMIRQATTLARELARGLAPVELEENDLPAALGKLAEQTHSLFQVTCDLSVSPGPVALPPDVALQFYRIAQEAVSNAVRHGKASRIVMDITGGRSITLTIRDNGIGLPDPALRGRGMGLEVMEYRARMSQADFAIARHCNGGTLVSVSWPTQDLKRVDNDRHSIAHPIARLAC